MADSGRLAGVILFTVAMGGLVFTQVLAIREAGNGLSRTGDPYSEANSLRAAQHYVEYGFFVDMGLPHIIYGTRFPTTGWVVDQEKFPLTSGVYTRYPPLPDLMCGVLEALIGFDHLWAWRLLPVGLGLIATIYAFVGLQKVLDSTAAGVVTLLISIVPMATSHMHGLHFQGYAQALFVIQLTLLVRMIFSPAQPSVMNYAAIFALSFLQGCLSFEYLFVVTAAAVPLFLLARAHYIAISVRALAWLVALSGAAFALAHVLHFLQVTAFYGSLSGALKDFSARAMYRFNGEGELSYPVQVFRNLVRYFVFFWLVPFNNHFGPFLMTISVLTFWKRIVGKNKVLLANTASYLIAALWLFVMPSHARIHTHIVPRIFFLCYFVAVLTVVLGVFGRRERLPSINEASFD